MHHVQTPDFCEKIGLETTESENFSPRSPTKSSFLVYPKKDLSDILDSQVTCTIQTVSQ